LRAIWLAEPKRKPFEHAAKAEKPSVSQRRAWQPAKGVYFGGVADEFFGGLVSRGCGLFPPVDILTPLATWFLIWFRWFFLQTEWILPAEGGRCPTETHHSFSVPAPIPAFLPFVVWTGGGDYAGTTRIET